MHLFLCQRILRMRLQTGIFYPLNFRVIFEKFGNYLCRFLCFFQTQAKRFQPAVHHVCLMWIHIAAHVVHHRLQHLVVLLAGRNNHAGYYVGVAVDGFCHRMHYHVSAQVDRPLKIRATKSIINYQRDVMLVGDFCQSFQIGDPNGRIGGSFGVNHCRFGTDGAAHLIQIGGVDVGIFDTKTRKNRLHHATCGAIKAVVTDDMFAGAQKGKVNCGDGSHARRGGDAGKTVFEIRHRTLQRIDGRVAQTCVNISVAFARKTSSSVIGIFKFES